MKEIFPQFVNMWNIKRICIHLLYWVVATCLLWLFINAKSNDSLLVFWLTLLLIPVTAATSYISNYYLIETLLLDRKYLEFGVYGTFTLIASVHLQLMLMTVVFSFLADYSMEVLGPVAINIAYVGTGSYFLIFLSASIYLFKRYVQLDETKVEQSAGHETLQVRVDRKMQVIPLSDIQYIESLSNYVKIHTQGKSYITMEKISHLEANLPDMFLRIHRSFLINQSYIDSFGKEQVTIGETALNIGRTYKKQVHARLAPLGAA